MIEIKKHKEPKELVWYKKQKGASYENMSGEIKQKVLDSLMKEQGHLCAYCMRRIPETRKLPMNVKSATIEHWYPQNPDSEDEIGQGLDYRNMLAVCSGNRGCGNKKNTTCDAHRGNSELKVNPCDYRTLQKISYRSDGRIFSSDKDINKDLNDILNLNCQAISLPENRKQVLNQLLLDIKKKCPKGDIKQYCNRKLQQLDNRDDKVPFEGILVWWLKEHS